MVPYFRSVWAHIDPTHKHFFTVQSFIYFDSENKLSDNTNMLIIDIEF